MLRLQLRGPRVPMHPDAAADAATPPRRPILKTAAALFRQGADAALYGFLAVCWAHSLGGVAVQILARWVYGEGSAAEAIGAAVRAACWFAMPRLFPVIFPLMLMRIVEHAAFVKEKEKSREEPASNEQPPQRNGALHMLPEGISLAPLYLIPPLCRLMCTATMMKHTHGEGSSMWKVGSVLLDMAHFALAVTNGFVFQNLVILVTVPRVAKDEYA